MLHFPMLKSVKKKKKKTKIRIGFLQIYLYLCLKSYPMWKDVGHTS